ncbi:MAG TPA: hypothetical protein VM328_11385 [Fimbriimonadaceae bacterium]|nr:hypothetical protein [Fimbriimonadaceae bacterium]
MKKPLILVSCAVTAAAASIWAAQAGRAMINGKPVPGRMIDGSLYVKLSDVAKALDMQIVNRAGVYEVVRPGGANQLQGLTGKVGQELFTGKWRFLVKDVQRVDSYTLKYSESKLELTSDPGSDLVILNCRFKNGVQESVYMYFNGLANTALTDMDEQTYRIKWMDVRGGVADTILPGAAKDFALVFHVPEGAELKDLVYSIEPVDLKKYGLTDLRISLR